MGPLKLKELPSGALLLVNSAPIIYVLEDHKQLAARRVLRACRQECATEKVSGEE